MSEVELYLIRDGENCTIYTLQFLRDMESEFEKFIAKFREDAEYSEDYSRIAALSSPVLRRPAHWSVIFVLRAKLMIQSWLCRLSPLNSDYIACVYPTGFSYWETAV